MCLSSERCGTSVLPNVGEGGPLSPAATKEWIHALLELDAASAAQQVRSSLSAMQDSAISQQRRLAVLEEYRDVIPTITFRLIDRWAGKRLPLCPTSRSDFELLSDLHKSLAAAYASTAACGAGRRSRLSKPAHAMLIHRAVVSFSAVCRDAYRVYQPVPEGVWRGIHELIQQAHTHQLLKFPVADKFNTFKSYTTITHVYKQILLTAAANPYQLAHGEIDEIYNRCHEWAVHAVLTAPPLVPQDRCQFLVDVRNDGPAYVCRDLVPINDREGYFLLDTARLVVTLYQEHQQLSKELTENGWRLLPITELDRKRLLDDLIGRWGGRMRRKGLRLSATDQRPVICGFDTVTYYLNGKQVLNWQHTQDNQDIELARGTYGAQRLQTVKRASDLGQWNCVDESASGIQLTKTDVEPLPVRVGDLVAVRRPLRGRPAWDVGVVRWLCNDAPAKITIGVFKLGPIAAPAMIQDFVDTPSNAESANKPPTLAVTMVMPVGGANAHSIAAPKGALMSGKRVRLITERCSCVVQARALRLATSSMECFEFEIVQILSGDASALESASACTSAA